MVFRLFGVKYYDSVFAGIQKALQFTHQFLTTYESSDDKTYQKCFPAFCFTYNGNEVANADEFVYFKNEGTDIEIEALENCLVLVLSGEPINEPIAQYGPFLMNKPEEIQQAINDYNQGKFGYLD